MFDADEPGAQSRPCRGPPRRGARNEEKLRKFLEPSPMMAGIHQPVGVSAPTSSGRER